MNYQKHLETVKSINDQFRYYKTIDVVKSDENKENQKSENK